jgi:hypothetical protein
MTVATFTNNTGISLSMAVWLAHDSYDHNDDPFTISATSLMKPVRQLVLASRLPKVTDPVDIQSLVASRLGTAVHNEIERVWRNHYKEAMAALGYPKMVIDRIRIDPSPEEAKDPDIIAVYMEQRSHRKVGKWTISGKFDFIGDGRVEDFKTTGAYTYTNNTKAEDYKIQGSLYRWLNEDKVTQDTMAIQFLFTDWAGFRAKQDANYPPNRVMDKAYNLMTVAETTAWVRQKLDQLERMLALPEPELPPCSDKDLWKDPTVYKYYANPAKLTRATKNFTDYAAAEVHRIQAGKGVVIPVEGQVKACRTCPCFELCTQKDAYLNEGSLVLG